MAVLTQNQNSRSRIVLVIFIVIVVAATLAAVLILINPKRPSLDPTTLEDAPEAASSLKLPIDLNDPSLSTTPVVLYFVDGIIDSIDDTDSNRRKVFLRSGRGPSFPFPIEIHSDFVINTVGGNGRLIATESAKILKKNDSVFVDIIYDIKTKELRVSALRLRLL